MSGLTAWRICLIEIDGSGPRRPPFYYSCSKKDYQGLMEPRSLAEVFCDWADLMFTGLAWEFEEKLKGRLIWTVIDIRSVTGWQEERSCGMVYGQGEQFYFKIGTRILCYKKRNLETRGQFVDLVWLCWMYQPFKLKYVLAHMQTDLVAPFYLYNLLHTTVNLWRNSDSLDKGTSAAAAWNYALDFDFSLVFLLSFFPFSLPLSLSFSPPSLSILFLLPYHFSSLFIRKERHCVFQGYPKSPCQPTTLAEKWLYWKMRCPRNIASFLTICKNNHAFIIT